MRGGACAETAVSLSAKSSDAFVKNSRGKTVAEKTERATFSAAHSCISLVSNEAKR